jgi:hypothetical protein
MNSSKIIVSMVVVMILGVGKLSLAQAPDTAWTRIHIGDYLGYFHGQSIISTQDSCFVVAGDLMGQAMILKLDGHGDSLWGIFTMISFGSGFYKIAQLAEGNIVAGGWYHGLSGGRQAYVLICNNAGDVIGGLYLYVEMVGNYGANCIALTVDGGFLIIDYPHDRLRLTKVNTNYEIDWQRDYGDIGHPGIGCVRSTSDGGYIYAGSSSNDGFLIKLDSDGDTLWTRTHGGSGNDYFDEIVQASDGGYMILGSTNSSGAGGYDVYLVRTNLTGDTLWTRTMGTSGDDDGASIDKTPNNGYIISVNMYDSTWTSINNIIRLNDSGEVLWTKMIDPDATTKGNSIVTLPDNGYALTGWFDKGDSQTKGLWVARLAPDPVGIEEQSPQTPSDISLSQNYPNPFNSSTVVELTLTDESPANLSIYDISGRRVSEIYLGILPAGTHKVSWDGRALSSGIYFYKLKAGHLEQTRKMVLVR